MTDVVRKQCEQFFSELKQLGIIRSVVADLGPELASILTSNGYRWGNKSSAKVGPKKFKNFDKNDGITAGLPLCRAVVEALPRVKYLQDRPGEEVGRAYERAFGEKFRTFGSGADYELFQREDAPRLVENPPLLGDYFIYRIETRRDDNVNGGLKSSVSRSFIRFYPHEKNGIRFMMLSLFKPEDYLAARGWVSDLEDCYLCAGQTITRESPERSGEAIQGGIFALAVAKKPDVGFVVYSSSKQERIESAPVLHMRATHRFTPSLARGYLIRCEGVEHLGGAKNQSLEERYHNIRVLQNKLSKIYPKEMSPNNAARELSRATGWAASVFFGDNTSRSASIDPTNHRREPSGLLVNIPFRSHAQLKMPLPTPLTFPTKNVFGTKVRKVDTLPKIVVSQEKLKPN